MSVQLFELVEVIMFEISDDALEGEANAFADGTYNSTGYPTAEC